jgi:hypothetical protein
MFQPLLFARVIMTHDEIIALGLPSALERGRRSQGARLYPQQNLKPGDAFFPVPIGVVGTILAGRDTGIAVHP